MISYFVNTVFDVFYSFANGFVYSIYLFFFSKLSLEDVHFVNNNNNNNNTHIHIHTEILTHTDRN